MAQPFAMSTDLSATLSVSPVIEGGDKFAGFASAQTRESRILWSIPRDDARRDVLDYIEMFYNPKRKHMNNGMLSPVDVGNRQHKLNQADV